MRVMRKVCCLHRLQAGDCHFHPLPHPPRQRLISIQLQTLETEAVVVRHSGRDERGPCAWRQTPGGECEAVAATKETEDAVAFQCDSFHVISTPRQSKVGRSSASRPSQGRRILFRISVARRQSEWKHNKLRLVERSRPPEMRSAPDWRQGSVVGGSGRQTVP